jgi:hypothetical protein
MNAGRKDGMSTRSEGSAGAELVERLRAAGYDVIPATHDTLPDPEHTLPPRRRGVRRRLGHALRRLWTGTSSHGRVKHAPVP